jgi:hypothetical protein
MVEATKEIAFENALELEMKMSKNHCLVEKVTID